MLRLQNVKSSNDEHLHMDDFNDDQNLRATTKQIVANAKVFLNTKQKNEKIFFVIHFIVFIIM